MTDGMPDATTADDTRAMIGPRVAKPATDLLPPDVLLAVAQLLADSAEEHAARDFAGGRPWSADYAALLRHALAFWAGEDIDPKSGRSHAIHLAARGLLLAAAALRFPEHDDRPGLTRPPTGPPAARPPQQAATD